MAEKHLWTEEAMANNHSWVNMVANSIDLAVLRFWVILSNNFMYWNIRFIYSSAFVENASYNVIFLTLFHSIFGQHEKWNEKYYSMWGGRYVEMVNQKLWLSELFDGLNIFWLKSYSVVVSSLNTIYAVYFVGSR